jgi:hypothetical protein
LVIVYVTPGTDKSIDLCIYIDSGQLVSNGINPYDFNDGKELRNLLRTDNVAYDEWVSRTQEKWDTYACSNLPLSLLYYGAIDYFFTGDALAYRIVFSFADALLSSLIVLFLIRYSGLKAGLFNLTFISLIGIFTPILLLWGSVIPEDKGIQILLMLLAAIFSKEKNILLSAIFLGFSVAFKGLGVFIQLGSIPRPYGSALKP